MSYDVLLKENNGDTVHFDKKHFMVGGTYAIGGTNEAWLNITYNYSRWYKKDDVFPGASGIRTLDGMNAKDSIPLLHQAIQTLEATDEDLTEEEIRDYRISGADGYWMPTRENAIEALKQLLTMANIRPDTTWEVL